LFAKATDNPAGPKAIPSGPELLDQLVANLPDNVSPEVVIKLAQKRFGVTMKLSALQITGTGDVEEFVPDDPAYREPTAQLRNLSKRTATAKKMYESMALVPQNSKDNPSLKVMQREGMFKSMSRNTATGSISTTKTAGGSYNSGAKRVKMKGRPGDREQNYGQTLIDKGELPEAANDVFKPVSDAPVERFKKANAHEIGHSVDDRLGFMAAREGQAAFGGWTVHGGDLNSIARQVAKKHGGDQARTLEQFVLDVIGGGNPDIPAVAPVDQVAVNQACAAIRDWHTKATTRQPWYKQSVCEELAMEDGRVYYEAYAQRWVSYPLAERAKGISGYQFRAPGEWFSELFSAYKMGKLKQGHPARQWLSSLQL
jgi:hypothetical protein